MNRIKSLELKLRLAFMISLVAIAGAGAFGYVEASTGDQAAAPAPAITLWQDTVPPTVDETADEVGDALQDPSPIQNWQIILAFVMPGIVEFFRKLNWTDQQKMAASFAITALVTTVTLLLQGQLDLGLDYVTTVLKIFALTIPAYYGMWKPLGLAGQTGKTYGVR